MELKRTVSNRVISISPTLVKGMGWNNMVNFIMAHNSLAENNEAAEDGCKKYQYHNQVVNCKMRPEGKYWTIQPGVDILFK